MRRPSRCSFEIEYADLNPVCRDKTGTRSRLRFNTGIHLAIYFLVEPRPNDPLIPHAVGTDHITVLATEYDLAGYILDRIWELIVNGK